MTRRLGVVAILILVAAAAACSSGSTNSSTAGADPTSEDVAASEPDAASGESVAAGGTAMAASSPIGAFFDGGFDEALADYTLRVEESIVVCMAAQGFDFAVSNNGRASEIEQRQNELTTREWTSEYGFGISTSFDSVLQNQSSDPNTAIFLSMNESERELWAQTLTGGDIGLGGPDIGSRPLEDQGCVGQALIETGGQEAIEGLSEFGAVYDEGQAALLDGREMVEAVDGWSQCMGQAGFANFAALDEPEDSIADRFDEVIAPMSAALENLTDQEGQALISGESLDIADLPDLDIDALRELQADEVILALADLDCYETEVRDIYEPLRDDFERGLLTEYADEFDALKNIAS